MSLTKTAAHKMDHKFMLVRNLNTQLLAKHYKHLEIITSIIPSLRRIYNIISMPARTHTFTYTFQTNYQKHKTKSEDKDWYICQANDYKN